MDGQPTPTEIEALDSEYYLVRGQEGDDPVEVRVRADADFRERLGLREIDPSLVVRSALAYLLQHQRLDELPDEVDLDDVVVTYPDFEEVLVGTVRADTAG